MAVLRALMERRGSIIGTSRREPAKDASCASRLCLKHRRRNCYRIRNLAHILNIEKVTQSLLFDLRTDEVQCDEGHRIASANRSDVLRYAQGIAVSIAKLRDDRCVSSDDIYRHLSLEQSRQLGNATGSLFRGPQWKFTGRRQQSQRITTHSSWIRVWKLLRPGEARVQF
jgi:hypothetical protein